MPALTLSFFSCSLQAALVWVTLVLPVALIGSPVLGIVFLSKKSPFYGRLVRVKKKLEHERITTND